MSVREYPIFSQLPPATLRYTLYFVAPSTSFQVTSMPPSATAFAATSSGAAIRMTVLVWVSNSSFSKLAVQVPTPAAVQVGSVVTA